LETLSTDLHEYVNSV